MLKKALRKGIEQYRLSRNRKRMIELESCNMNNVKLNNLTTVEWSEVREKWQKISSLHLLPKYYQMFKTLDHFDSDFVSDDIFMPFILRSLNDERESQSFEHKGMYDILFGDSVKRPKTVVNCINGTCYSENGDIIPHEILFGGLECAEECIVKPTKGSCMGRNVRKIKLSDKTLNEVLLSYGDNFIVQKVVKQSSLTSLFNASSLNTFRISTLNINGRVSLCTILFRCGQAGSSVDNGAAGGLMAGVYANGHFRDFAYDNKYNRYYETKQGVKFSDGFIPNMPTIVEEVKSIHQKCLPNMGFAGWDIALDENNCPVMIEVNLSWPGVQFEQLCPGLPIFGDRTAEVIEYVLRKKKK